VAIKKNPPEYFTLAKPQEIDIKLHKINIQLRGEKILVLAHSFKFFIKGDCDKNRCEKYLPSIQLFFPSLQLYIIVIFQSAHFFTTLQLYKFTALQQRNSYFDFNFNRRFF